MKTFKLIAQCFSKRFSDLAWARIRNIRIQLGLRFERWIEAKRDESNVDL